MKKSLNRSFKWFSIWVVLMLLFSLKEGALASDPLPIYYSTPIPVKVRQDAIQSEMGKMNLDATFFGKFRDFIDNVKRASPKVLVAPSSFQKYYSDYVPMLRFNYEDGPKFKYQILSLKSGEPKSLDSARIGVVQEVDQEHLNEWVSQVTGSNFKIIRPVMKPEDLFPMLIFQSSDMILISPDNLKRLREKFVTEVKQVRESNPIFGPTIYFKKAYDSKPLVDAFLALSPKILASLGFSSIEKYGENSP